jgi:hypothetical protein
MQPFGIVLLLLVGLNGSEYVCGKKRAYLSIRKGKPPLIPSKANGGHPKRG